MNFKNLTDLQIKHLAELAKLKLKDQEVAKYRQHLTDILDYMETIKNLDLTAVPETSRVTEEENVWRKDEVKFSFTQKQALQNAPKTHQGFFVVPRIIENGE